MSESFKEMKMEDIDALSDKDFELFVKELLAKHGWRDLHVTQVGIDARHGDGGYDIVGYKENKKWLFEVKQRSNSKVGSSALNQIVKAGAKYNVKNLAIITNSYFTSSLESDANSLDVELIDRNKLRNLMLQDSIDLGRRREPRKYQAEIINELITRTKKGENEFLIEMATGLGKTITSIYAVKELFNILNLESPRVLFVAHQKEIVKQSSLRFKENLGITKYSYSVCYEGSTVGDHDFVFATYHTLLPQKENLKEDTFDIIIIDECHHAPAKSFSNIKSMLKPKILIGLSATPDRNDGKSTAEFFGGDSQRLGKLSLGWSIANGYLARPYYNLLTSDIDVEALNNIQYGLSVSDIDKKVFLNKKDEEVVRIVNERVDALGLNSVKGVVFCRSIRHIKNMMNYFPPGSAIEVHSQLPKERISENISKFREGNYKYILVRDIFNEGIDIPEINLIIFLRKTSSKTIWLQQLGRGLRKLDDKDRVEVFDFVGSVNRIFEVDELNNEVNREAKKALQLYDSDNAELDKDVIESMTKDDVLYDDTIAASFEKSAVDIKKLLNEMQLVKKEKDDCILDLKNTFEELGYIPTYDEFIENLFYANEATLGTLFSSYLDLIYKVFGNMELQDQIVELEDTITSLILDKYNELSSKLKIEASANTVAIYLNEKEFPLCTIKKIKDTIANLEDDNIITFEKPRPKSPEVTQTSSGLIKDIFKEYQQLGSPGEDDVPNNLLDKIYEDYLSFDEFLEDFKKES